MYKLTATALVLAIAAQVPLSAVDGDKAGYVGGTYLPYAGKDDVEGKLNTDDVEALILAPKKLAELRIPYGKIIDIEYGQKAGRRVGMAVGLAFVNPIGLTALFSKKRKHYLTIGYMGADGKEQVAVLELGKDIVRATLPIVEARSGKTLEYQDEEAKKASRN